MRALQTHPRARRYCAGVRAGAKWTRGVERKAAYAAALAPFADASELLSELTGLEMSASEIDRLAQLHGERIDKQQRKKERSYLAPIDPLREPPQPDQHCARQVV